MEDLVQFLRDRLDEDEQTAHAATWDEQSDVWTARPPKAVYERYTVVDYCDDGVVAVTPENADADGVGQHVARHDPARVLREVEAKREILRWHTTPHTVVDGFCTKDGGPCTHRGEAQCTLCGETGCTTVRLLALPYADHPDYRDTWRP